MGNVAIKCPFCNTVFSCNAKELVEGKVTCPNCGIRLTLAVIPNLKMDQIVALSYVQLLNQVNRLYDILIKKLEKVID